MSVRSRIAALVVALAVAATTIAGGVAQAAPLVPCATLSVGSVAPATITVKSKKLVAAPVHVCALTSLVPYC